MERVSNRVQNTERFGGKRSIIRNAVRFLVQRFYNLQYLSEVLL